MDISRVAEVLIINAAFSATPHALGDFHMIEVLIAAVVATNNQRPFGSITEVNLQFGAL
jgi:hypothetical protein